MIFVRPTKSDSSLKKLKADYLLQEKKEINSLQIELNKLRKENKINPSQENEIKIKTLAKNIYNKDVAWRHSEGFKLKMGGELNQIGRAHV